MAIGVGGARRDRTDDLKLAKLALSQLSYGPVSYGPDHPDRGALHGSAAALKHFRPITSIRTFGPTRACGGPGKI